MLRFKWFQDNVFFVICLFAIFLYLRCLGLLFCVEHVVFLMSVLRLSSLETVVFFEVFRLFSASPFSRSCQKKAFFASTVRRFLLVLRLS